MDTHRLLTAAGRLVRGLARTVARERAEESRRTRREERRPEPRRRSGPVPRPTGYPGDYVGVPTVEYQPVPGDRPDPGEVVWAWVPYEEDHGRGKDRPVLLIGRDGPWLLALPLTSLDHDRDAAQEAAEGRYWVDIGSGGWDARGRASEVRVDRIIRLDPDAVRRTTVALDARTFDRVADAVRHHARR